MAAFKILAFTLLAGLASCEPPVQGLNAPSYNSYQAPSTSYGVPSNSYSAPSSSYGAPSSGYGAPSSGYGAPSSGYGAPSSGYGAPSSGFGGYDSGNNHGHDNEEPKAYEFGYSVKDAHSGNDYDRKEHSDGNTVRGEYRVQLPDGRLQIVTYHADWQTGFHADVRYEGEARYPEPSHNNNAYAGAGHGHGQDNGGYNYNAPSPSGGDFSGSLTGFQGNSYSKPSSSYGTPQFH